MCDTDLAAGKGTPMIRDFPQIREPQRHAAIAAKPVARSMAPIDTLFPVPDQAIGEAPSEAGVAAMQNAFTLSGGLLRADDPVGSLRERQRGDYVGLARMIARSEVCSYEWQRSLWLPMFQFDPHEFTVEQSAGMVLDELRNEFEQWALVAWFARPNAWLADRRPVDLLRANPPAVLEAACADRYIATRQPVHAR